MPEINFTVNGVPKGQPRVKAFVRGKHAGVYDPGTADGWKSLVALAGRPLRPASPIEGPVAVSMVFYFPRPKRLLTKKFRDVMGIMHTGKPDSDNAAKACLDCLMQDGWFRDDAQVCKLQVEKRYAEADGAPGAFIAVSWEDPEREPEKIPTEFA